MDFGYILPIVCSLFTILQTNHVACELDIESNIVTSHSTKSGQRVVIFDQLFQESSLEALNVLILDFSPWQLTHDQELQLSTSSRKPGKGDLEMELECSDEKFPWSVQIPSSVFTKFNIWTKLQQSLTYITEKDDYRPSRITAQMLQRGVSMNTTCGLERNVKEDYIFRLFLTPDWKKNDYGDVTLFNIDEDHDEFDSVLLNVKPKYGRAVIWDAGIPYLSHAPSMSYLEDLIFVTVHCTRDKELVKASQKEVESKLVEIDSSQFFRFPKLKKKPNIKAGLSNKEVKQFQDQDERPVKTFDNLFSNGDIANLKTYATQEGPNFQYHQYDVEIMETTDNVKWIKQFEPEDFVHTQWWKVIADVTKHVSGNTAGWYPYDVALKVAVSTDHLRVQEDSEIWEDEYTFLMYLNSDETSAMLGETAFFDRPADDEEMEEEFLVDDFYQLTSYDAIGAVQPSSGRVVVFHGAIPYSTRPPTSTYQGMSFTFAVKMAATKTFAIAKRLRKIIEDYPGDLSDEDEDLLEELYDASIKGEITRTEKWLMQQLNTYILKLEDYKDMQAKKAKSILMAS